MTNHDFKGRINLRRHGIGVIIDCETTGLSAERHAAVEVAIVKFAFERDPKNEPAILGTIDQYHGLRDPGDAAINPMSMRINGLCLHQLRGQSWSKTRLNQVLKGAEFAIAHNAAFDRRFLLPVIPQLANLSWYCTIHGVPWREHGIEKRSLKALCLQFGLPAPDHSAFGDAIALLNLLQHPLGQNLSVFRHLQAQA